jgi:hypothetical protein
MSITIAAKTREMNLSNANFYRLASCLELSIQDPNCGYICPDQLLLAVAICTPDDLVQEGYEEGGDGKCTVISCGLSLQQACRYLYMLGIIAQEAKDLGIQVSYA